MKIDTFSRENLKEYDPLYWVRSLSFDLSAQKRIEYKRNVNDLSDLIKADNDANREIRLVKKIK
jgi:hypothetical protein